MPYLLQRMGLEYMVILEGGRGEKSGGRGMRESEQSRKWEGGRVAGWADIEPIYTLSEKVCTCAITPHIKVLAYASPLLEPQLH